MRLRLLACAGALVLALTPLQQAAGQAAKNKKTTASAAPASARLWKSETTGKEYRVWTEKGVLRTEWVNIPRQFAKGGAYIRSELHRAGSKWAGTSKLRLPCESSENNKLVSNWCLLETKIEIGSQTANRITGRGESLKRFDCRACKVVETGWAAFEWVPKKTEAGGSKQ